MTIELHKGDGGGLSTEGLYRINAEVTKVQKYRLIIDQNPGDPDIYCKELRKEDNIQRVDSSSQYTMAMMMSKGRCDFAIMNEHNARAVMFNKTFCSSEFYQSPNVVSRTRLVFVIRSDL